MMKLFRKKQPASAPVLPSWDPFFELRELLARNGRAFDAALQLQAAPVPAVVPQGTMDFAVKAERSR